MSASKNVIARLNFRKSESWRTSLEASDCFASSERKAIRSYSRLAAATSSFRTVGKSYSETELRLNAFSPSRLVLRSFLLANDDFGDQFVPYCHDLVAFGFASQVEVDRPLSQFGGLSEAAGEQSLEGPEQGLALGGVVCLENSRWCAV